MGDLTENALAIIGALLSVINFWFWNDKKRQDGEVRELKDKLEATVTDLAVQKSRIVDDSSVRKIAKEETDTIREDHRDLRNLVVNLTDKINVLTNSQTQQSTLLTTILEQVKEIRNRGGTTP